MASMKMFRVTWLVASTALAAAALLNLSPQPLTAQVLEPAAEEERIVREIEIQFSGVPSVSRERILANMATTVGQPFSQEVAERDTENLFRSGLVENVRIFQDVAETGDGVKVIVIVEPRATLGEVVINGADQINQRRIRREITVSPGEPLRESEVEISRQQIEQLYIDRGFPDTEVVYDLQPIAETGNVRVVYNIIESGKQIIKEIEFEGNTVFTEKELLDVMETRPRGLFSFFGKAGRLREDVLQDDLLKIQQLYQDAGYIDAEVGPVIKESMGKNRVRLIIPVEEGGTYTIGTMTFTGNELISDEEIRAMFQMTEGETFKQGELREDIQALREFYGRRGYVDAQIVPELSPGGGNVINIDFLIEEGLQAYVGRVNIDGNQKTQDKVIRRELAVAPGDLYDTDLVDASQSRLQNLGYFSRVQMFPSDTLDEGVKDLNVVVEEQHTGSLQFGAGFSSIDELVGFAEVQQSNFDITDWPGFTGGGQKFRLRAQFGTERADALVSLTEPWFLDRRLELSTEAYYRQSSFFSDEYDQQNVGASVGLRWPLGDFSYISTRYRLEQIKIDDVDENASQVIRDAEGDYLRSQISGAWVYDTRDDLYLPRKGEKIEVGARLAGLGGDVELYGWGIEAIKYWNGPYDTIFLLEGEVAFVDGLGGSADDVPIFDRLYLGGANDLRGFEYREVGPKDEFGEPIGGRSLARLTAEMTFPVIQRVRGAVFYDVGMVDAGAYELGADLNSDIGVGVRLDLPIGPIRVDVGFPLQTDEFNDSDAQFNFNVGYRF
jgi:outer membrane protein insertion porin family